MTVNKERALLTGWLIINLAIGLWIVRDYGMSTDEPYYYLYADDSLEAYKSFFGQLFEPAYGVTNLRYYGPAFIVLVNAIIRILHWLPVDFLEVRVWHYAYFVTFQLTGLCLFGLAKRWFSRWTAWAVLVLFITQPLLWGHAFINPKDVPFMFFFTFSVWVGYLLVDSVAEEKITLSVKKVLNDFRIRWESIDPPKRQTFLFWLLFIVIGLVFSRGLVYFITEKVINFFYYAAPDSWAANLRHHFAEDISRIPVEDYVAKVQTLFARFDFVWYLFGLVIIGIYLSFLLINPSLCGKIKGWWQRLSLKDSNSRPQIWSPIRSQASIQKLHEFFRQTATALFTPKVFLAGMILGVSTSIRVIGPLAGVLVILYLVIQLRKRSFPIIIAYSLWAAMVTYLSWPFLWHSPVNHIFESLTLMADFPWGGTTLFNGRLYTVSNLPMNYLPVLLNLQFTEPFVVLWYLGVGFFIWRLLRKEIRVDLILYIGLGFLFPMIGMIILRSPLYENFRQLLFLLPAMFILGAFTLDFWFAKIQKYWLRFATILFIIIPGLISLVKLHPYQYIYYNSFIGGVQGAFRRYELDYWYTSLGELSSWVNENVEEEATIVARVGHRLITHQLRANFTVEKIGSSSFDPNDDYDYAILTTRWNTDEYYPDAEIIAVVERDGGILAVLKDIKGHELE